MYKFKCEVIPPKLTLEVEYTSKTKRLCDIEVNIKEAYKRHYSKKIFPHHYTLLAVRKANESNDDAVVFGPELTIREAKDIYGENLVLVFYTECNESALLSVKLPMPTYATKFESCLYSQPIYGMAPETVKTWYDFERDLPDKETFSHNPKRSLNLPEFSQHMVYNENDVFDMVESNILKVLDKLYHKNYSLSFNSSHFDWDEADEISSSYHFKGSPDWSFRDYKTDETLLAISAATKWETNIKNEESLASAYFYGLKDVENGTATSFTKSLISQINRIFTYMTLNRLQYGILTTYENTWFLSRPKERPENLLISKSFSPISKQPTLLKVFASFLYMVSKDQTLPEKIVKKFYISPDNIPITKCCSFMKSITINEECLGSGRMGSVFTGNFEGEEVVLKLCDISRHPEFLNDMIKEVETYKQMKPIQGIYIPKLICNGYILNGMFYVIGTSYSGKCMKTFDDDDDDDDDYDESGVITRKEYDLAIIALKAIHSFGILHKDIRPENILLLGEPNEQKAIRIIDFGFSTGSSDEKEKDKEVERLTLLLDMFLNQSCRHC